MSLASKFPIKSTDITCCMDGANVFIKEPEVLSSPKDVIQWNASIPKNPLHQSPKTPQEPTKYQDSSRIKTNSIIELQTHSLEDEVLSSQDSFNSSILQGNGGIRSSSGSNSEAEDTANGCMLKQDRGSKSFQFGGSNLCEEFYNSLDKTSPIHDGYDNCLTFTQLLYYPEDQESPAPSGNSNLNKTSTLDLLTAENVDTYSRDHVLCSTSTASGLPTASTAKRAGQLTELVGETMLLQEGFSMPEKMLVQDLRASSSNYSIQEPQVDQLIPNARCNKTCKEGTSSEHVEVPMSVQNKVMQHVGNAPEFERTSNVEERVSVENKSAEPNSGNQLLSAQKEETNQNASKAKKGKADAEKKTKFDWDSLRRKVQCNGKKTERSIESMDSMDYEALRRADVSVISDAIRERGMNNMLAERIQVKYSCFTSRTLIYLVKCIKIIVPD